MKRDDVSASDSSGLRTEQASVNKTLLVTLADTTWRMFLPTVGFLLLGRTADNRFGTKPWLFATGTIIGMVVAGLLVRRQLIGGKA